jgi:hypothetical protein
MNDREFAAFVSAVNSVTCVCSDAGGPVIGGTDGVEVPARNTVPRMRALLSRD